MSATLTVYDKITDAGSFIKTMGREIAASKMFGDLTTSQGEVFALECAARRMPPLMLAEKYHVIFGKLSMKAEAMLGEFHERGGKSRIVSRTPELVAIELELNGSKQQFSLSWAEAEQESFPYATPKGVTEDAVIEKIIAWKSGKRGASQPELKTKYKTPRSRTQMLWARLVSDAVRAMMPEVNSGRYTPEEFDGGDEEPEAGSDGGQVIDGEFTVVPEAKPGAATGKPENGNGQHVEPETAATATASTTATESPADTCLATPDQVTSICAAMNQLGMPDELRGKALAKRGVNEIPKLSHAQAAELLANLNAKIDQRRQAALDAANGRTATPATSEQPANPAAEQPALRPDDGTLCSEVQVATVKQLVAEIHQTDPKFGPRFKELLFASGRKVVAEFTAVQCDALIEQLKKKNLEAFFAESLKPKN